VEDTFMKCFIPIDILGAAIWSDVCSVWRFELRLLSCLIILWSSVYKGVGIRS